MTSAFIHSPNPRLKVFLPRFDPELVPLLFTKVEGWELYQVDVLPRGLSLCGQAAVATSHADAIGLPAIVVVDRRTALWFDRGDVTTPVMGILPGKGITGAGRLSPPVELNAQEDLERHRALLAASGDWAGVEPDRWLGGTAASSDQIAAHEGRGWDGTPVGLERCDGCGEHRGSCLAGPEEERAFVTVRCACEPPSGCIGCGRPFHPRRLRSNHFDPETGEVRYVPGLLALEHECVSVPAVV